MILERIKNTVREVKDFPKPGIQFKDVSTIFLDQALCNDIIDSFIKLLGNTKVDAIIGIESRGFILGMLLANKLNVPFVIVRKVGKLPSHTFQFEYALEYGNATIEVHKDAIKPGWNVLIHDDLLATGGTAAAAAELVKMVNAKVAGFAFLIELAFLNGEEKIKGYSDNIIKLAQY